MDGATEANYKMMLQVIKFIFDTENYKLIMKTNGEINKMEIKGFCDSDFAGDLDTRRSVSGYIIYVNDCPLSWRSRGQKSVTLSSTEAEYVSISEIVVEILFIKSIFEFMNVKFELPIKVHVDNIGAIFLAKKATTSNKTKHVDTRYHFIREYIKKKQIIIEFIRSEENDLDIMTKNLPEAPYWKHASKLIEEVKFENRKGVED